MDAGNDFAFYFQFDSISFLNIGKGYGFAISAFCDLNIGTNNEFFNLVFLGFYGEFSSRRINSFTINRQSSLKMLRTASISGAVLIW